MNDRRVGPPGRASRGGGRPPATMATQARYQPPMASYAPRPVGPWQALRTADGKHVYYHNAATNETTWTRPPDYVDPGPPGGLFPASGSVAAAPSAASAPSSVTQIPVPGTTWYEVTQPGKPSYFHDAATRAVVWAPPPAVLEARTTARTFSATETTVPPRDATETTRKRARDETDAASNAKETLSKTRVATAAKADPESPRRKETPPLDDDDDDVEFDPEAYEDDCFEEIEEEPRAGPPAGVEDVVAVGTYSRVPRSELAPNDASPPSGFVETDAARAAREFRELLTEKGVDKTSRWDRKARELSSDSRFKAVRSHAERRRLFERHARDAGDAAKKEPDDETKKNKKAEAEKRNEKAAAARAEARREKAHFARLSARELADANVARLRVKNARDVASERFGVLLAESEKKWNLAESRPPAFDDAKKALFADAQGRATAVPGAFEEADMRALFEAHVARAIHARLVDVAELLDEKLVARSAKDFEVCPDSDADEDADDDVSGKNPLASFVAASAFEPLVSDPRWDRCPVEQRAAAYCRRVEALCSELNVGDVPEDVAALRDALAEAREKRLKKGGDDEPEEGEAVDDGAS